jgi:LPS O-antigen subunit length determinant protein (WzzB/FepE family)
MQSEIGSSGMAVADPQGSGLIDLAVLVGAIRRDRWLIIAAISLCTAVAIVLAFTMQRVYRAEVLLSPVVTESGSGALASLVGSAGGLANLVGAGFSDTSNRHEYVALLRSRTLAESFVKEEELMPLFFPKLWDERSRKWIGNDAVPPPSLGRAATYFGSSIRKVAESRQTGLVTLSMEWHEHERVAQWANEYVKHANRLARQRAIEEADRAVQYLQAELERTNVIDLRQSMYNLIERQISRRMLATVNEEFAFRIIDAAKPPEPYEFVRPRRLMYIAAGFLLGMLTGLMLCAVRSAWYASRPVLQPVR